MENIGSFSPHKLAAYLYTYSKLLHSVRYHLEIGEDSIYQLLKCGTGVLDESILRLTFDTDSFKTDPYALGKYFSYLLNQQIDAVIDRIISYVEYTDDFHVTKKTYSIIKDDALDTTLGTENMLSQMHLAFNVCIETAHSEKQYVLSRRLLESFLNDYLRNYLFKYRSLITEGTSVLRHACLLTEVLLDIVMIATQCRPGVYDVLFDVISHLPTNGDYAYMYSVEPIMLACLPFGGSALCKEVYSPVQEPADIRASSIEVYNMINVLTTSDGTIKSKLLSHKGV